MEDSGALEVDIGDLDLEWSNVFGDTPDVMVSDLFEFEHNLCFPTSDSLSQGPVDATEAPSNPSLDDSVSPWIGRIEDLLMKDDDNCEVFEAPQFCTQFFSDVLVDSPPQPLDTPADRPVVVDDALDKISGDSEDGCPEKMKKNGVLHGSNSLNNDDDVDDILEEDEEDPASKKRRRQLRNKDAALRSRERKKVYVKDLEMKSRYLEGECRRLGRLLQCCSAENHVLRLQLQLQNNKAFGVSVTKQESAVLLLESLLLGSLLWVLGIIWLYPLPAQDQLNQGAIPQESVGSRVVESGTPRASKLIPSKCRRCKSSKIKMKLMTFMDGGWGEAASSPGMSLNFFIFYVLLF